MRPGLKLFLSAKKQLDIYELTSSECSRFLGILPNRLGFSKKSSN